MTPEACWRLATEWLADQHVTLVLDTTSDSLDDTWAAARRDHGPRVAVARVHGGRWTADGIAHTTDGQEHVDRVVWVWVDNPEVGVATHRVLDRLFFVRGEAPDDDVFEVHL